MSRLGKLLKDINGLQGLLHWSRIEPDECRVVVAQAGGWAR